MWVGIHWVRDDLLCDIFRSKPNGDVGEHQTLTALFPLDIPIDTAIPAWAYLNVTGGNKWDPVASRAALG